MPSSGSSLEDRARAFAVAQDFGAEALDLNRRLIVANPADSGARTRLARCYLQAGRPEDAEAEYREALRLNPRNRIAIGGLEEIERLRNPPASAAAPRKRAASTRQARAARIEDGSSFDSAIFAEPAPESFTGFGDAEFAELARCRRRDVQERFALRVVDLLRRVNALGSSVEMAGVREAGKRQLFRTSRGDVHSAAARWHVFNLGGRLEPQCNIGMSADRAAGNWFRIGLGFDLDDAHDHLRRFQEIVASPRGSLFLGWFVKEDARPQLAGGAPMLDVREPSDAAHLIAGIDPARARSVFFGKWLQAEDPEAAAVLRDPVMLVRTIDRVFSGLLPFWRALFS